MSRGTRSCCRKRLLRRVAWESPPHQEGSARSASLLLELPLEASAASVLRRPEASGASGSQLPVASEVSLRPLWLRPEALVRSRRRLREASGALRSRHLGASGRSPSNPRAASAPSPSRLPGVLVALLNPLQLEVGLARPRLSVDRTLHVRSLRLRSRRTGAGPVCPRGKIFSTI